MNPFKGRSGLLFAVLMPLMLPSVLPEPLRWVWLMLAILWALSAMGVVSVKLLGRVVPGNFWTPFGAFWLLRAVATMPAAWPLAWDGPTTAAREQTSPRPAGRTKPQRSKGIRGKIIDLGNAPYEFKAGNRLSFYITLRQSCGTDTTVWGIDLRRVAREMSLAAGNTVELEFVGRKAVVVEEPVRNRQGVIVGYRQVSTHRNSWKATVLST